MTNCNKCNTELKGQYCSICGNPKTLTRIGSQYIIKEISSILNFEKGILYTIKALFIDPGRSVRNFLLEDRTKLVKPIAFLILCTIVYIIFAQINPKSGYSTFNNTQAWDSNMIYRWSWEYRGFSNIFIICFQSLWARILYRRLNYNFFEIFILLSFVVGVQMLILALFELFSYLRPIEIPYFASIIAFSYTTYAIGQFFDKKKVLSYFKGLLVQLLGFITFFLLIFVLQLLIDFLD